MARALNALLTASAQEDPQQASRRARHMRPVCRLRRHHRRASATRATTPTRLVQLVLCVQPDRSAKETTPFKTRPRVLLTPPRQQAPLDSPTVNASRGTMGPQATVSCVRKTTTAPRTAPEWRALSMHLRERAPPRARVTWGMKANATAGPALSVPPTTIVPTGATACRSRVVIMLSRRRGRTRRTIAIAL